MNLTINDIELKRIFRDIQNYSEISGAEKVLMELGLLSEWMRKSEAVEKLGSKRTYQKAVEKGILHERKIGKGKNSPIVVRREEVNYINFICLSPEF